MPPIAPGGQRFKCVFLIIRYPCTGCVKIPASPEEAAAGEPQGPGQAPSGALPNQPQQQAPSALQQLAAGLSSSGQPNLSANVTRRQPA